jgi:hypothetical protein
MRLLALAQISSFVAIHCFSTIAAAQRLPPPPVALCQQSTIEGNWILTSAGGNPSGMLACPITITKSGVLAIGSCAFSNPVIDFSGTLTINSSCFASGNISWTAGNSNAFTFSLSLWLSADGSRLSGYGVRTQSFPGGSGNAIGSFDLISVPLALGKNGPH